MLSPDRRYQWNGYGWVPLISTPWQLSGARGLVYAEAGLGCLSAACAAVVGLAAAVLGNADNGGAGLATAGELLLAFLVGAAAIFGAAVMMASRMLRTPWAYWGQLVLQSMLALGAVAAVITAGQGNLIIVALTGMAIPGAVIALLLSRAAREAAPRGTSG